MRVSFFAKAKTNVGPLPLSRWKTIEILKIVLRFQSLNFTGNPKGYLLQTTKLWEKLIVLNRRKKNAAKPKEEVNFLSGEKGKFCYYLFIFFSNTQDFAFAPVEEMSTETFSV